MALSFSLTHSGGMLFRCQTCAVALCEDCLPEEGWLQIGDNLPEFELLNYDKQSTAYYIRCPGCVEHFQLHPEDLETWEKEEMATKAALSKRELHRAQGAA